MLNSLFLTPGVRVRELVIPSCVFLLAALLPSGSASGAFDVSAPWAPSADGRLSEHPSVEAFRLEGQTIVLDGRLDDAAWESGRAARGFRTWDPIRGELPSEETAFEVAYDEEAIYFGVACYEKDPSRIASQLCRRDNMSDSDIVSIYLDTYHDHSTGYNFRVNPAGSKLDLYVFDDGQMDTNWDAVWDVATSSDMHGWYAEFRIPFSAVRYRPADEMTWGLQVYRYMHRRGEDTAWVTWDRETRGFVSRFGELRGLRGIPAARQLELLPYAVARATDPSAPAADDGLRAGGNFGLDLKYGVTTDLTLNATFQPDFGQVEADPALLNLSPFETYYDEKRPFFIEGSRFFAHPDFEVFYSRRVGTGDPNARIRFAGKLTGKTVQGVSIAALYAATDITGEGQAHNFLKSGEQLTHYFVGRLGKEFAGGLHRVNVMQTVVVRAADRDTYGDFASRDALTTAVDFDLNFHDRDYNVSGSAVGSAIDPASLSSDPSVPHDPIYGTAGSLALRKLGGTTRGGVNSSWKTDRVDLNDAGYMRVPDEVNSSGWLEYVHDPGDASALVTEGSLELDVWRNWLYAGGRGFDRETGEVVWSYGPGHPESVGTSINGWCQFRSYWTASAGVNWEDAGTSKYGTRTYEGVPGPLMSYPSSVSAWGNVGTDWRKPLSLNVNGSGWQSDAGGRGLSAAIGVGWNPTQRVSVSLNTSLGADHSATQHLANFAHDGGGIGGVSYVFAELDQRTVDATLRADVLFTRDVSLQLYAQPYLTAGDYRNPRELVRPDSYDLTPAEGIPGFEPSDVHSFDFKYSAVNVNVVFRWEYAAGSTFYLVWKQGRDVYEERAGSPGFSTALDAGDLLDNEPENTLLAKLTYWFSL